jgi:hypothetical protein
MTGAARERNGTQRESYECLTLEESSPPSNRGLSFGARVKLTIRAAKADSYTCRDGRTRQSKAWLRLRADLGWLLFCQPTQFFGRCEEYFNAPSCCVY